jgi:hypothetical protein
MKRKCEDLETNPRLRQKYIALNDMITKWMGQCIMVDGFEFLIEKNEYERLLHFENEYVIDGKYWYPIASSKDAILYVDETGKFFKSICHPPPCLLEDLVPRTL